MGSGDAMALAEPDRVSLERVDLEALAVHQIVVERGIAARAERVEVT
jgi:hypothetical protein